MNHALRPSARDALPRRSGGGGGTVTVSLGGLTYASGVSASSFALVTNPTIAGLSIGNVTGGASGSTLATLTLATGAGYGFSTASTLAVRVLAAAHSGSPDLTSGTLAVSPTPGVTLSRRSLALEEDPGTGSAHEGTSRPGSPPRASRWSRPSRTSASAAAR